MDNILNESSSSPSDKHKDATLPTQRRFQFSMAFLTFVTIICVPFLAVLVLQHQAHSHAEALLTTFENTPAIKFTLHFKRTSMNYHGQDSAELFILPRPEANGSHASYDGVLDLQHGEIMEKYLYVDHHAYYIKTNGSNITAATCLAAKDVPKFNSLVATVHNAREIDRAWVGDAAMDSIVDCADGHLLSFKFGGEPFIACTVGFDRIGRIFGQDMDIDVEYLSSLKGVPSMDIPTELTASSLSCDAIAPQDKSFKKTAIASMTNLAHREARIAGAECECQGERKHCLFVHGLFVFIDSPMTDSFPLYWGDIHEHVPCCLSTKFVHFDTINQGWNDDSLQQDFCQAALEVSGATDTTVGPLNVITHSMGNMIAGAALATGKCKFSNDVTWISSAGPMRGSQGPNWMADRCEQDGGVNELLKGPLEYLSFCPLTRAFESLKYIDTLDKTNQDLLVAAQQARASHPNKKVICGTDGYGITSVYSLPLELMGELVPHSGLNDGAVALESCVAGLGDDIVFDGLITSPHYKGRINHEDLAFRNGDGWLGDDRKPVKWLSCAF
ncbi:hypothetical protein AC1031_005712 [Aphanomyces cochlioides]|nr:hypothetical protein AC1031_005712 [Aphanomyces cochlioides]